MTDRIVMSRLAGNSPEGGKYLEMLWNEHLLSGSPVFSFSYETISRKTSLSRNLQDLAIRKLKTKPWFHHERSSLFGQPGLLFSLDIAALKIELVATLEAVREAKPNEI